MHGLIAHYLMVFVFILIDLRCDLASCFYLLSICDFIFLSLSACSVFLEGALLPNLMDRHHFMLLLRVSIAIGLFCMVSHKLYLESVFLYPLGLLMREVITLTDIDEVLILLRFFILIHSIFRDHFLLRLGPSTFLLVHQSGPWRNLNSLIVHPSEKLLLRKLP